MHIHTKSSSGANTRDLASRRLDLQRLHGAAAAASRLQLPFSRMARLAALAVTLLLLIGPCLPTAVAEQELEQKQEQEQQADGSGDSGGSGDAFHSARADLVHALFGARRSEAKRDEGVGLHTGAPDGPKTNSLNTKLHPQQATRRASPSQSAAATRSRRSMRAPRGRRRARRRRRSWPPPPPPLPGRPPPRPVPGG